MVIPTFNREKVLLRAIDSVLAQTFCDFELLVMDDGSTDETRVRIEALNEPRLRYTWMPNSGGPATPRNRGLGMATGTWVCLLDADDYWLPHKLEKLAQVAIESSDCDVICHNQERLHVPTGHRSTLRYGPLAPRMYETMLVEGNRLANSATALRRAFMDEHELRFNTNPSYVIVEDFDMWLHIARLGGRFRFLDDVLGVYTIEQDNISLDETRYWPNLTQLLRDHVFTHQAFANNPEALWRCVQAGLLVSEANLLLKRHRPLEAIKRLSKAFWDAPTVTVAHVRRRLEARLLGSRP